MFNAKMIYGVFIGMVWGLAACKGGEPEKCTYTVSKPYTLDSVEVSSTLNKYVAPEIYIDAENRIIVTCSYAIRENDEQKGVNCLLFVNSGREEWVSRRLMEPGFLYYGGMINNGVFQAWILKFIDSQKAYSQMAVYTLTSDLNLPWSPGKTDPSTIVINAFDGSRIFPVAGDPNRFFSIGGYEEKNILLALMAAGHGGFSSGALISSIEKGRMGESYKLPMKLEDREILKYMDSEVVGDRFHVVWRKHREYSNDKSNSLLYSCFDWKTRTWLTPEEPFLGYKNEKDTSYHIYNISMEHYQGNIHCVVSWYGYNGKRHVSSQDSGIYYISKMNGKWEEPFKITDNAGIGSSQSQVIVDDKGQIYIFWPARGIDGGIFFRRRTDSGWSETIPLLQNENLEPYNFSPSMYWRKGFSIAKDKNNNFHFVYRLFWEDLFGKGQHVSELVYVKMTFPD